MDPFLGEIRIFAGNFAPRSWALCNGQLLPIAQNTALYSLLGNYYGGDGRVTFALPDFQGRAPMHWGNGAGLTPRQLGETGGSPTVTLNLAQLPMHSHSMNAVPGGRGSGGASGDNPSPSNNYYAAPVSALYIGSPQNVTPMSTSAIGPTGGNQPHNNMQPYLAMSFIISLQGIFPQRP